MSGLDYAAEKLRDVVRTLDRVPPDEKTGPVLVDDATLPDRLLEAWGEKGIVLASDMPDSETADMLAKLKAWIRPLAFTQGPEAKLAAARQAESLLRELARRLLAARQAKR
jgi:hypothetical protein